jgi:hypothetical protein
MPVGAGQPVVNGVDRQEVRGAGVAHHLDRVLLRDPVHSDAPMDVKPLMARRRVGT